MMNKQSTDKLREHVLLRMIRLQENADIMVSAYLRGAGHREEADQLVVRMENEAQDAIAFLPRLQLLVEDGKLPLSIYALIANNNVVHQLLHHRKVPYVKDPCVNEESRQLFEVVLKELGCGDLATLVVSDPVAFTELTDQGSTMLFGRDADSVKTLIEEMRSSPQATEPDSHVHGPGCGHDHHGGGKDFVGESLMNDPLADDILKVVSGGEVMPLHAVGAIGESLHRYARIHPAQATLALEAACQSAIMIAADGLRATGQVPPSHHTGESGLQIHARSVVNACLTALAVRSGDEQMLCENCLMGTAINGIGGVLLETGMPYRKLVSSLENTLNGMRLEMNKQKSSKQRRR